ncbi:conserved hypothetical protein [uncultured Defluviicoccus sp.]|uniref:TIGR04255 family protein n=1 Tax=metagenome TaxID=256318 RepID=A0A380TJ60_9ZZZZ|nr:conserved hypothetical protein [uncultured Defluviicoccus sp.]
MSDQSPASLPSFRSPPLVEVALGFFLADPTEFSYAHVGKFWSTLEPEFPTVRDVDPVSMSVEDSDGAPVSPTEVPLFPRIWMMDRDEQYLVQIQRNAFFLNWRPGKENAAYPRFPAVFHRFNDLRRRYARFMADAASPLGRTEQLELTYINHIPEESISGSEGLAWAVLDDLRPPTRKRWLNRPDRLALATSFRLPDDAGRLYIRAQTAIGRRTRANLVSLTLTAKANVSDVQDSDIVRRWYETAHSWIVRGFEDVTTRMAREAWGEERQVDG